MQNTHEEEIKCVQVKKKTEPLAFMRSCVTHAHNLAQVVRLIVNKCVRKREFVHQHIDHHVVGGGALFLFLSLVNIDNQNNFRGSEGLHRPTKRIKKDFFNK